MFGAIPVGSLEAIAYQPGVFPKREYYKEMYKKLAKKTVLILNGKKKIDPLTLNKTYFEGLKNKVKYASEYLVFEYNYWKNSGWLDVSYKSAVKLYNEKLSGNN